MAFEQGLATSQEDFVTKLQAFAGANGWTIDNFSTSTDKLSMHNGNIYAHLGWDNTDSIEVHQSLGFISAGTALDSHTNDSGNGGLGASDRGLNDIGNGPFTSHFFYANSTPAPHLYAVLEYAPGFYRHFAAGELEKIGDWTGGEFVCTTTWNQQVAEIDIENSDSHCVLMDGACNHSGRSSTLHLESLPDQPASGKWGIYARLVAPGNDGDANGRVNLLGGMRGGPYTPVMCSFPTSLTQGFVPLAPVPSFYIDTAASPDRAYLLGYAPNMRTINVSAFEARAELQLGGDTWQIFPMIRKGSSSSDVESTGFGGIAYKKT